MTKTQAEDVLEHAKEIGKTGWVEQVVKNTNGWATMIRVTAEHDEGLTSISTRTLMTPEAAVDFFAPTVVESNV